MSSSRNKLMAFGMIAGGLYAAYRISQRGAPVNGLGALGFSLRKSISSVTQAVTAPITRVVPASVAKPVMAIATGGASELARASSSVISDPSKFAASVKSVADKVSPTALAVKFAVKKDPLVKRFTGGGRSTNQGVQPAPDQVVVYQDARGNTISEAQYNVIMQVVGRLSPPLYSGPGALYTDSAGQQFTENEYQAWLQAGGAPALQYQTKAPVSDPYQQSAASPAQSFTDPSVAQPAASSGGGSGSGTSYADAASAFGPDTSTAPAADAAPAQQYAPAPGDSMAAPSKLNPFVIVGAALLGGAVLMLNKHH